MSQPSIVALAQLAKAASALVSPHLLARYSLPPQVAAYHLKEAITKI